MPGHGCSIPVVLDILKTAWQGSKGHDFTYISAVAAFPLLHQLMWLHPSRRERRAQVVVSGVELIQCGSFRAVAATDGKLNAVLMGQVPNPRGWAGTDGNLNVVSMKVPNPRDWAGAGEKLKIGGCG
jgi:hypothetical protein